MARRRRMPGIVIRSSSCRVNPGRSPSLASTKDAVSAGGGKAHGLSWPGPLQRDGFFEFVGERSGSKPRIAGTRPARAVSRAFAGRERAPQLWVLDARRAVALSKKLRIEHA